MTPNLEDILENLDAEPFTPKAVVLFSGGQDSTTILGYAIKIHGAENVLALSAYYGQRHKVELEQAADICHKLGVRHEVLDVSVLGHTFNSGLTSAYTSVSDPHPEMPEVPNSFVPMRNAILLTLAFGVATRDGAGVVYGGMCQTDYSGYPDCRHDFVETLSEALRIGYMANVEIDTPLMYLTKAETFALAEAAGVLDIVLTGSHTCYEGDRATLHPWGYGCGVCPACQLRAKGWDEYKTQFAA